MSFAKVFQPSIQNLAQVAKNLDDNIVFFCSQLAKRLEVDETKVVVEFKACLQYLELAETKQIEKVKAKFVSDEEKQEKLRLKELEKAEKEAKKAQEKAEKEAKKEQEKAEKLAAKAPKSSKTSSKSSPAQKIEEVHFDFENEEPVQFEEDSEFWKGKTMKVGGKSCFFNEKTNLFLQKEDDSVVLYALKNDKKAIPEADIDVNIKIWVEKCGIKVPSLDQEVEFE